MLKLAHIINPVKVPESSDLFVAQPVTYESMRRAAEFAADQAQVELYAVGYAEDAEIIPDYFKSLPNLERSVLDVAQFSRSRKLPLIADILDKAKQVDADYLVYTNVDISLMPHFYSAISNYISKGYDAIAINRKTISYEYTQVEDLPKMYAQIGQKHEGIDCFVFRKQWLDDFYWGNSIIGSGPVGIAFCLNMIAKAQKFIWLEGADLTFHLGDDKAWTDPTQMDYVDFSYNALAEIAKRLRSNNHNDPEQLFATTAKFCEDVVRNREVASKFGSNNKPKPLIRAISNKNQG